MPFAEEMLKKNGEFFPFGATVTTQGEVQAAGTYDGNETPAPEVVISTLVQAFQANARDGKVRATGICYDGRVIQNNNKVDAVIISLEHSSGSATKTCVPYTKGMFGKYKFGELIASLDDPKVFVNA